MTTLSRAVRTAAATILVAGIGVIGASTPASAALPVGTTVDTNGPDDEPGQKDLNQATVGAEFVDGDNGRTIAVTFNLDDTTVPGNNTLDACALFDSDGDGLANYALCESINTTDGTTVTIGYDCSADQREDRCAGPEVEAIASSGTSSVVPNSDPFRNQAVHADGNTCTESPSCVTDDTVVSLTARLRDFGNPVTTELINVCTYPSQQPNSDPSDCITGPNEADLQIAKTSSSDSVAAGSSFTYNLRVTNNGPDDAIGVVVTDSVPNAFTVTAVDSAALTCTFMANDIRCTTATLAFRSVASVTITVAVKNDVVAGTFTNTAIVKAGTFDPTPANNTATDDVAAVATTTTTTVAPTTTAPTTVAPTTVAPPAINPVAVTLPQTGATDTTNAIAAIAALFLLIGAGSMVAARRNAG
ncbi:MAG: DUF11 domain-containing protein [Ilumatobacteraceae bacterium]